MCELSVCMRCRKQWTAETSSEWKNGCTVTRLFNFNSNAWPVYCGSNPALMVSHFVMAAFASKGQLFLSLLLVTNKSYFLQYHGMLCCNMSWVGKGASSISHPFSVWHTPNSWHNTINICTLIADPLFFVKCVSCCLHSFGGCCSTVAERVLPVPECERMQVGETVGTCRCFYKVWVLQLPSYLQIQLDP